MKEHSLQGPGANRRDLLRSLAAIPVGVVAARVVGSMGEDDTGVEAQIDGPPEGSRGAINIDYAATAVRAGAANPVVKELVHHEVNTLVRGVRATDSSSEGRGELVPGRSHDSEQPTASRREFVAGAMSSVVLALSHNMVDRTLDTKTARVPQLLVYVLGSLWRK